MREVVRREPAIDLAMAASTAARAATRSSAWRTWKATEGPLRSTNSHAGVPRTSGTRVASTSAGASESRGRHGKWFEAGRVPAAPERTRLKAVVAEIDDAADPGPRRDVGRGPTGQDRYATRVGRPAASPPAGGARAERAERWPRPGSRDPSASVPSKSHTTSSRQGPLPAGRSPGSVDPPEIAWSPPAGPTAL